MKHPAELFVAWIGTMVVILLATYFVNRLISRKQRNIYHKLPCQGDRKWDCNSCSAREACAGL